MAKLTKRQTSNLQIALTAVVAAIPAADFFGVADLAAVKVYSISLRHIHTNSHSLNLFIVNCIAGGIAFVASLLMGLAIIKSKRLRGGYKMMEERYQAKRDKRSPITRAIVTVITSPFVALQKIGEAAEWLGNKAKRVKSKPLNDLGVLSKDFGHVLAISSTAVIADATFAGKPPTVKRTVWISVLGSFAILALIELGRIIYQKATFLRTPMNAVTDVFDKLTGVNFGAPWTTPVGSIAFVLVVASLLYSGASIALQYRDQ